jgi:hypothetical protein
VRGLTTWRLQALIDDLVYNTEFFTEHAINSASWLADCPGGTKLHYSPNTPEARGIAHDAMRRLACDSYTCDPGDDAGAGAHPHVLRRLQRTWVLVSWRAGG